MKSRSLTPLLFSLCFWLAGCIMVPVPTAENKVLSGKQVKDEQLTFLSPGSTTKQEIVERIGNPTVIWEDARVFAYRWEMRHGILFWAIGAYYSGAFGMSDLPRKYLFLLQFDEQDRVRRFEKKICSSYTSYPDCLIEWVGDGSIKAPPMTPDKEGDQ